jgi:hypothetical protein
MSVYRKLYTSSRNSGGGTLSEPLELEQTATSKVGFQAGVDSENGTKQALGGAFEAFAQSADGSDRGSSVFQKLQNAVGDAFKAYHRTAALLRTTYFDTPDPGNSQAYMAFGKMLGTITGPYTFNGNTGGATAETTILTGTLPANTAAPGHKVEIAGSINLATVNGADTLTIKVKRGATTLATAAVVAGDVGPVGITLSDLFQSIGASGNAYNQTGIAGSATSDSASGSFSFDTTTSKAYTVTAQWSSSNAGNTAVFSFLHINYKLA